MPEFTKHDPGMFCWYELGTSDTDAAKKFYGMLFGWGAVDTPAAPGMTYTLLQLKGKDVGALYQLTDEHKKLGVPPHWLTYVSVASADESAEKATALGGKVTMGPFDVMDVGRMAVIEDPTGAVFAIWQAKSHPGARLKDETNTFCWSELATSDVDKAKEFYTQLFGWGTKSGDMGPMVYTELMNGSTPIGGMLPIAAEWGNVPPHWLNYIAVEDCDGLANNAKEQGANIISPPMDIPNVGRFAVIQDPQGAVFAIIKLTFQG
jgi:predicted enzyme related to lactoylglutathione lyase